MYDREWYYTVATLYVSGNYMVLVIGKHVICMKIYTSKYKFNACLYDTPFLLIFQRTDNNNFYYCIHIIPCMQCFLALNYCY